MAATSAPGRTWSVAVADLKLKGEWSMVWQSRKERFLPIFLNRLPHSFRSVASIEINSSLVTIAEPLKSGPPKNRSGTLKKSRLILLQSRFGAPCAERNDGKKQNCSVVT